MTFCASNPEIIELSDSLFSALLREQAKIKGIQPADPSKKEILEQKLAEYESLKGRGFFYPFMASGRGHGPFCELIDGSVKYDLINGIGVNLLGHSHPLYIRGALESATSDTIMCGNLMSYQEPYELSKVLLESVKKTRLKHFWFAGSGSFANDSALKMIWQKKAPHYKLLAFTKAFAGRSIATQNITYNASYREGMPTSIDVTHIPHFDQNHPESSLTTTLEALDQAWKKEKGEFCALMIELIQGEGGFIYGTKEYYQGIFDWAKEKGIYIWVDEVQSFMRTPELFSFQYFGLDEYVDVVTVGKALQACGTFYTEELNPKPGLIAGTFNGAIAGLNVGKKTLEFLKEGNFYGPTGKITQLEKKFLSKLRDLNKKCKGLVPYCGGIGTMISFEVDDSSKESTTKFIKKLFENGIISFMAGSAPTRVRFLLPLCLTDEHIDEIFSLIEKTLKETF